MVNVLVDYPWHPWAVKKYGQETHDLLDEIFWKSGYWEGLDLGTVSPEEFLEKCYALRPGHEELIRGIFWEVGECASLFPYTIPWIQELKKQGYQVLLLSNYPDFIRDLRPDVLEFLPYMDGGFFSCDIHMVKPHADIFHHICKAYGLEPAECLFIDDNLENVRSARECQLHAIQFLGYEKTYPEICDYLEQRSDKK